MMDDAMDGAMDDGDAEDETNDVVSKARGARCGECAVRCAGRADVVARLRAGGPVQRAPHLACHPTLCTLPTHAARCMRCGLGLLQQPSFAQQVCHHTQAGGLPATARRAAQVLDEIGIDTSAAIGAAPARRVAAPPQRAPAAAAAVADEEGTSLTARLAALK